MSKKILKRSLALGALMAFVITGSAWADVTINLSGNEERGAIALFESGALKCNLNDYKLSVNAPSSSGIWVNGFAYDIKGSEKSILAISAGANGLAAHGKVDVGTLNITAGCYAIQAYSNNTIIEADNINLTAGSAGLNVISDYPGQTPMVDVDFSSSLTIAGINGARGIESIGHSGTVSINGAEGSVLAINTTGDAIYANHNSKVYVNTELNANNQLKYSGGSNTTITGAIEAQDSAQINFGLKGDQSKFTGKVTTGENATTNLILEGGTWNVTDDSVVSSIVVSGDVTIDGAKADGTKSSLKLNKKIEADEQYAIHNKSGDLTIKNIIIENIEKTFSDGDGKRDEVVYGSVLYNSLQDGGEITISDSILRNNKHTGDDKNYAIMHITGDDMTIENSVLSSNESSYMGSALIYSTGTLNITESTFDSNKAGTEGGAFVANKATVNLIGSGKGNSFEGNEAGVNGGAINTQGNGTIVNLSGVNIFKDNVAGKNGGAICLMYENTMNVDGNTTFKGNTAGANGGAIFVDTNTKLDFVGEATFSGNTANGKGNDIYNIGELNINQGAKVKLDGGIDGTGTTNINDGTLELAGGVTNIYKLGGEKGVIHFSSADANLSVETNDNKTLKFTATSAVNEAVAGDANALVSEVDWAADTTMVMEAGDIVGEITAELGENKDTGKLVVKSQTEAANPANQAISDAGVGLKLHYRYHMNDMNKRMGELRNANGEHGVWTRMVRGECEYENSKAQYNQYQLGYDEKLSVDKRWTVGAAVTFSEGDSSYGYGSTEDKSTAFAIYGSKLNNDGTFVDLIARYAHLESDVEDKAGKGDYSTNGMSVSAEFGKRIQQGNGLWIEPQFELTYGNIDSAEFQIGGKTVQVGDMDSLIGRIGFSLGKDIKQGNVYARASYLYDFDGETETAFSNSSATRTFKDDLGGGWWEVGVGANINLSKATYIYADVEKTFGGEVDTNWQWNLGVRYSF